MSSLSSSTRRIDMYDWSRRHNASQACYLYAERRGRQWLGGGVFHECDESCEHDEACDRCKFCFESDNGNDWYCLILEVLESEGLSFNKAHNQAREQVREVG